MGRTQQSVIYGLGMALGAAVWMWQLGQRFWLVGGIIVVLSLVIWFVTLPKAEAPSDDVLSAFDSHLAQFAAPAQNQQNQLWQESVSLARSAHSAAIAIATTDSFYAGDVITALHSILALLERLALGLQAQGKVETPTYRAMVQHHIETSHQRLSDTCLQLQTLRDQLTVAGLNKATVTTTNLSAAISANQATLSEQFPQA